MPYTSRPSEGTTKVGHKIGWLALSAGACAGVVGIGWLLFTGISTEAGRAPTSHDAPIPVEVADVRKAPMEHRRTFTGTLEAAASVDVAAKVAGRVEKIGVDLGDIVQRGQVIAELDAEEYAQAVAQAKADVAVAEAERSAAAKTVEITRRAFKRVEDLHSRSIAADQELDTLRAEKLTAEAQVAVTGSRVSRARAALKAASIRMEYTRVVADWSDGDESRVVAARHVDEGVTVAANTPLVSIVELDPVVVVVYATEKDYASLHAEQAVEIETDAFPGETFVGKVTRIAPVFRVESRQARVELTVENPDGRLKPGMFVRARTVLERIEDAVAVPKDALVDRNDEKVVFIVADDGKHVEQRPVEVGVESEGWVQVEGEGVSGRVVTLGQHQLEDGMEVSIVEETTP